MRCNVGQTSTWPLIEGLEAPNFGNAAERPRHRGESRRIAILRDEPKQAQSGLGGGEYSSFLTPINTVEARLNLPNWGHVLVKGGSGVIHRANPKPFFAAARITMRACRWSVGDAPARRERGGTSACQPNTIAPCSGEFR